MTASTELAAAPRTITGKTSKRLAAVGQIPAVLYGRGRDPLPLALDRHEFELFVAHHAAGSTIVELKVEGEKKPINAMIREVQRSSVKGTVLHVDLLEISMDHAVSATVALHLVNDPQGVREGGILNVILHELSIEAKPADLPEVIEHDVSGLGMGEALHISDITVPKGVTLVDDPETMIATVTAPKAEVEEGEGEEVEAAEPEVIGAAEEPSEE